MNKLVLPLAAVLALLPATVAGAAPVDYAENLPLPTGSLPEGVADAPGANVFAGARADGSVYRADLLTGDGEVVVPGRDGYAAVGMSYDRFADLLWVAGGGPLGGVGRGTVTAYDGTTFERVYERVIPAAGFLNDVVVTRDAVYVTDSGDASLVVVPLEDRRPAGEPTELPLGGEYVQPQGFGANGIVTAVTGDELVARERRRAVRGRPGQRRRHGARGRGRRAAAAATAWSATARRCGSSTARAATRPCSCTSPTGAARSSSRRC